MCVVSVYALERLRCHPWRNSIDFGSRGPAIHGRSFGTLRGSAAQAACLTQIDR